MNAKLYAKTQGFGKTALVTLLVVTLALVPTIGMAAANGDHGAPGPGPRPGAAMACHARLGRIVLDGGAAAGEPLFDLWMWAGKRWRALDAPELSDVFGAPRLSDPTMTEYDGGILLVGTAGERIETWMF